jgi:O-antigen/teichoic acid export membrane protein
MTADRLLPERLAGFARPWLRRADGLLSAPGETSEAQRVALIAFAIRIVNALIAFVSQVLLARWLGPFEYGIFVLVWVTMIIVGSLSCLGFHTTVIRFIPEYRETGQFSQLRGILFAGRLFALGSSTAIAALGLLGLWWFADAVESYYVVPFYLGIVCIPMIALSDLLQGVARAYGWAFAALTPIYLVRPLLVLVFMAGALAAGYEPNAVTAVVCAILATYATSIWQLATVAPRAAVQGGAGPRTVLFRHWFIVSMPIFLVESFFFLLTNADVLMIGRFMAPDDVAIYYATVKTLALVHFVYFAVKAGAAQRYAAMSHRDDKQALGDFARATVRWTFWPSLAMAGVVLLVGGPMLNLFGPHFDQGYPLLFVLVLGVVARAAVGPAESLLTMSGNQNVCALVYALTLALNVGLNLILIPQYGLWGAAIATTAAMCFEAAALSFTVWRRLGIAMAIFVPVSVSRKA